MSDLSGVGGRHKVSLSWLDRALDALADPARRERAVLALLAGYAAIWSLYGAIAKGSQDLHFDMGEMIAWSRELALGTPKHPPLPSWVVWAWFEIFPLQDWAYYLLAIVAATLALWVAWKASEPFLEGDKRLLGLALLTLVPFYNFHALKFNANSAMTPVWALTTWWFLRSYRTLKPLHAAWAGLAAAAAMLVKYWSIVLLVGLAIAALSDGRARAYFRSAAPWVTIAVGLVAMAPHLAWLYVEGFRPFRYAMESHPTGLWGAAVSGLGYVAGAAGYVAAPVLVALAAARPSWGAITDSAWPPAGDRRLALIAFAAPLLLPMIAAIAAGAAVVSLWAIGSMTLLPVVLLSSPQLVVTRAAARRILALAIAVPLVALALSPVIAVVIHRQGVPGDATHYRLVAQAAEQAWRETTEEPLRLIGSSNNVVYGTVFYFSDHPSTLEITKPEVTPWTDAQRVAREGIALFCPVEQVQCVDAMDALAARGPPGTRREVEVSRRFFGFADKPTRYVIVTVPPAQPARPARD
jgi:hypothetical protein